MKIKLSVEIIICAFTLLICSSSYAEGDPKIGVIVPLTGPLASVGEKVKRGIQMAAESEHFPQKNIIYEDGEFSNSKALSAYHKLVSVDKVQAVIGPFGPGQTQTILSKAKVKKIPIVAVSLCDIRFKALKGVFLYLLVPH